MKTIIPFFILLGFPYHLLFAAVVPPVAITAVGKSITLTADPSQPGSSTNSIEAFNDATEWKLVSCEVKNYKSTLASPADTDAAKLADCALSDKSDFNWGRSPLTCKAQSSAAGYFTVLFTGKYRKQGTSGAGESFTAETAFAAVGVNITAPKWISKGGPEELDVDYKPSDINNGLLELSGDKGLFYFYTSNGGSVNPSPVWDLSQNNTVVYLSAKGKSTGEGKLKVTHSASGASSADASIIVYNLEKLTLRDTAEPTNSVSSDSGTEDTLTIAENYDASSGIATASMDMVLEWLPAIPFPNKIRWKIERANQPGVSCTDWSSPSGVFTTSGTAVSMIWSCSDGNDVSRDYVVTAWFDADGDGTVSPNEAQQTLQTLKIKVTKLPAAGVTGANLAIEGSNERVIKLRMGRTKASSLTDALDVEFSINFVQVNTDGVHLEDFIGYDGIHSETIFFSNNVTKKANGNFCISIPANSAYSEELVMKAKPHTDGEALLEKCNLTVKPVNDKYYAGTGDAMGEYERVLPQITLNIAQSLTRFGTPNNTPLAHFENAVSMEDIRQGQWGNCYFLATLMALADTPSGRKLIVERTLQRQLASGAVEFEAAFKKPNDTNLSKYQFSTDSADFLSRGIRLSTITNQWHQDSDETPHTNLHRNNKPDIDDGVELWVQLYECAYAAYKGGWNKTYSGAPFLVWEDLTSQSGNVQSTTRINKAGNGIENKPIAEIFKIIQDAKSKGKLICVITKNKSEYGKDNIPALDRLYEKYPEKFAATHAYYLRNYLSDKKISKTTFILINPWGYHPTDKDVNKTLALNYEDLSVISSIHILNPVP